MDALTLDQFCVRAQTILVEDHRPVNQIITAAQQPRADAVEVITTRMGATLYAVYAPSPTT